MTSSCYDVKNTGSWIEALEKIFRKYLPDVELGIAFGSGKRCYGFKTDTRSVELGMDLNPMITGCFSKLFYSLDGEELMKSLSDYLSENPL